MSRFLSNRLIPPLDSFTLKFYFFSWVSLGREAMAPYCKPGLDGLPLFPLPGTSEVPLPFLGYAPGAYLSRVTDLALKQAPEPAYLDRVYETDMAEGLKAMAMEGHGIAFLPQSAVRKELTAKKLVRADHPRGRDALGF